MGIPGHGTPLRFPRPAEMSRRRPNIYRRWVRFGVQLWRQFGPGAGPVRPDAPGPLPVCALSRKSPLPVRTVSPCSTHATPLCLSSVVYVRRHFHAHVTHVSYINFDVIYCYQRYVRIRCTDSLGGCFVKKKFPPPPRRSFI